MKAKDILITLAALSAGALLLIFPKEMAQAVSLSCKDCLEIIIPSLFPFTVFAASFAVSKYEAITDTVCGTDFLIC